MKPEMRTAAKLNSQSGASLLLALLFIMICIMVGAVVLAASGISVERADSGREEEQVYLSLRSAAELVDDCISAFEYKVSTQQIVHNCPATSDHNREFEPITTYDPADTEFALQPNNNDPVYADTVLGRFISKAVQAIHNTDEDNYQIDFTIDTPRVTTSGGSSTDAVLNVAVLDTVKVKMQMDKACNITVTISSAANTYAPVYLYYPVILHSEEPRNEKLEDNLPAGYIGESYCSITERVYDITSNSWKDQTVVYDYRIITTTDIYRWETSTVSKAQGVS